MGVMNIIPITGAPRWFP